MKLRLLFLLLLVCAVVSAEAQIGVGLSIKRRNFLAHEPIIATVTLQNNTGRDLVLEDTPELQWFGFQVNGPEGIIIPPRNPNYGLDSVHMQPGETVRKSVNVNELYALGDYGTFTIRATVYSAAAKRYFTSKPFSVDITEGRAIARLTGGVPDGLVNAGSVHTFTLMTHHHETGRQLYVRVQDQEYGTVLGTYQLGRLLDGVPPQAEFDSSNNLHVMHLTANKSWVLSRIGVNGEFLGQTNYSAEKSRPTLRKLSDGRLQIVGGRKESAVAKVPTAPPVRLSDRPVGLPQ